ncbi:MAG: hypothetical protein ABSF98_17220 [Bryobacteraceae bacterium]
MKDTVRSVLKQMIRSEGAFGIRSFREMPDDSFRLETALSEFGHKTFLKYEATRDNEMFRIEIRHVFGRFAFDVPPTAAADQLLKMLTRNTGSFGETTAFIGAYPQGDTVYATLNSVHHFVTA